MEDSGKLEKKFDLSDSEEPKVFERHNPDPVLSIDEPDWKDDRADWNVLQVPHIFNQWQSTAADTSDVPRKHSSGDLHSRLKTRKILGVGETDNGDIHRSKISQLLGHNEHLYVRFPRGFWAWHLLLAVGLTGQGLVLLLLPTRAHDLGMLPQLTGTSEDSILATRYYGTALLGLAVLMWNFLGTTDKQQAKASFLAITVYHIILISVSALSAMRQGTLFDPKMVACMGMRSVVVIVTLLFRANIGKAVGGGMRKSTSFKDLSVQNNSEGAKKDN